MEAKLTIDIPETSNGFGHVFCGGRDIATAYGLDYEDDANAWAKIVCKVNDWPEERYSEVFRWLQRKAAYQRAKGKLKEAQNPFSNNGESDG